MEPDLFGAAEALPEVEALKVGAGGNRGAAHGSVLSAGGVGRSRARGGHGGVSEFFDCFDGDLCGALGPALAHVTREGEGGDGDSFSLGAPVEAASESKRWGDECDGRRERPEGDARFNRVLGFEVVANHPRDGCGEGEGENGEAKWHEEGAL